MPSEVLSWNHGNYAIWYTAIKIEYANPPMVAAILMSKVPYGDFRLTARH